MRGNSPASTISRPTSRAISTGLDVAASDADPLLADAFEDDNFNVVADVVAPHYDVIVTDTGSGVVHSVTRAALQRADTVLVVSGGGVDEARLASEALTWLEANHYGHLVSNAVVALNASTQGTDLDMIDDIEQHFRSRVRAVVRIPYDPELAAGSIVRYEALDPSPVPLPATSPRRSWTDSPSRASE